MMPVLHTHRDAILHEPPCSSCDKHFMTQRLYQFEFLAWAMGPWVYVFAVGLTGLAIAIPSAVSFQTFKFRDFLLPFHPLVELLSKPSIAGASFRSQHLDYLYSNHGISSSPRCLLATGLSNVHAAFWLSPCSWILLHNLIS